MTIWLTRIQKRIATNAKLLAWLGCITKKAETLLKAFCSKWKKHEIRQQPLDYEKKPYNKYKWEKLTGEKDEWN